MHHSHAPATDLAEDAVMGNRLPYGWGRHGHWLDMLGGDEGEVNVVRHPSHAAVVADELH